MTSVVLGTVSMIVIGGIIYYNTQQKKDKNYNQNLNKLLSDNDRYLGDKSIIEDAIREQDKELLESMLNSSTSDFPDLIEMIQKALKDMSND